MEYKILNEISSCEQESLTLIDKDLKILWVNSYLESKGFLLNNVIGQPYYEVFKNSCEIKSDDPVKQAFLTGRVIKKIEVGGDSKNYQITAIPIKNELGVVTTVLEKSKEIAGEICNLELKNKKDQLKESKDKYQAIFENSAVAITVTDESEKIISWNKFAEQFYGRVRKDLYMKHVKTLYPKEEWLKIRGANIRKKGMKHHFETKIQKLNGESMDIDISISVIRNKENKIIGSIGVARDISDRKKSEDMIIKEQAFSKQIIEGSPIPTFIIDSDHKVLYWNKALEELTGRPAGEVVGTNTSWFPFYLKKRNTMADFVIENPREANEQYPIVKKSTVVNGAYESKSFFNNLYIPGKWLYITAAPIYDHDDNLVGAIETMQDITEQENADKRLRMYKRAVDSSNDLIYIKDHNGNILYTNKKCEGILGYKPEELIGENVLELVPEDYKKQIQSDMEEVLIKGKVPTREIKLLRKDKKPVEVGIISSPFKLQNGTIMVMSIIRDITDRKKAQHKLFELNKNLEVMVHLRTNELKEEKDNVEELLRLKTEFINQLGHDIKNPLTPITILLPILQSQIEDPKLKTNMQIIIDNVNYLKELTVNTLKIGNLDSGKIVFSFDEFDIKDLINKVINQRMHQIKQFNVTISKRMSKSIVYADKLRIEELFENLLSNSFHYLKKRNKKIWVNAKTKGENVIVELRDNGMGAKKDSLKHIFTEFYKGDESRHDHSSSGLGLSICKRIIEKHNGKIWADSKGINKGFSIFFSLPKKK